MIFKPAITILFVLQLATIVTLILLITGVINNVNKYSDDMDQYVGKTSKVRFNEMLIDSSGKLNRVSHLLNKDKADDQNLLHLFRDNTQNESMLRLENDKPGSIFMDFKHKTSIYQLGIDHTLYNPKLRVKLPTTSSGFEVVSNNGSELMSVSGTGDSVFYGATTGRNMVWQKTNEKLLLKDNASISLGDNSDFTAKHDGTNSIFDSTSITGDIYWDLGTDTHTTKFAIRNNSGTEVFNATGDGSVTPYHKGIHTTRYQLHWTAGEHGKPGLSADATDASEATRLFTDRDFVVTGKNATSSRVAYWSSGGITLQTASADTDQTIITPHTTANLSVWKRTQWFTNFKPIWEALVTTGSNISDTVIWSGLKASDSSTIATDTNQVFFRYEASVNSGKWQTVYSIAGTDTTNNTDLTVATNTKYHFKIVVTATRAAYMYINGTLYDTTTALTDEVTLIPVIGVGNSGGIGIKSLVVHYQSISSDFYYTRVSLFSFSTFLILINETVVMTKNMYAYFKKGDIFLHITLNVTQKELIFYYTRNWSPFTKVEPAYLQVWVQALLAAPWKCKKVPKVKAQSVRREGRTTIPSHLLQKVLESQIKKFDWDQLDKSLPAKMEGFVQKQDKTLEMTFKIKLSHLGLLPVALMTCDAFQSELDMKEIEIDTLTFFPIRLLDPHASLPQEPKPYEPDECKSSDGSDDVGYSSSSDSEKSPEDEKKEVPNNATNKHRFHRIQDSNVLSHKRLSTDERKHLYRKPRRQHKSGATSETTNIPSAPAHTFKLGAAEKTDSTD